MYLKIKKYIFFFEVNLGHRIALILGCCNLILKILDCKGEPTNAYGLDGFILHNCIKTEKAVPISPENKAKIRYNVPISFAFEDKNHRSVQREMLDFFPILQR